MTISPLLQGQRPCNEPRLAEISRDGSLPAFQLSSRAVIPGAWHVRRPSSAQMVRQCSSFNKKKCWTTLSEVADAKLDEIYNSPPLRGCAEFELSVSSQRANSHQKAQLHEPQTYSNRHQPSRLSFHPAKIDKRLFCRDVRSSATAEACRQDAPRSTSRVTTRVAVSGRPIRSISSGLTRSRRSTFTAKA